MVARVVGLYENCEDADEWTKRDLKTEQELRHKRILNTIFLKLLNLMFNMCMKRHEHTIESDL